jgi:hypothetical protein
MMKSLDALISYLLEEVALCGKQGWSRFLVSGLVFRIRWKGDLLCNI